MARSPRVHFPGALYHVISRGNQKQTVFRDAEDYRRFGRLLEDVQGATKQSLTPSFVKIFPGELS
jgi:REP element-mobilizing transposase RayT